MKKISLCSKWCRASIKVPLIFIELSLPKKVFTKESGKSGVMIAMKKGGERERERMINTGDI